MKSYIIGVVILFTSINADYDALFQNKNVLILGGTGYLGKAIIAELLKYNPNKIVVFSRDEVKHFNLTKIYGINKKVHSMLGDIRDYERVCEATKDIDIVFHAAALKRIDSLELNTDECIKTNILGSMNVYKACIQNNVKKVIFISTDKASYPINTYGACKFISEKIFTNYDILNVKTQFMVARYGNVLDNTGSVIPIFIDKVKRGAELTLTDSNMTRFIINKDQAVTLIFDALLHGHGGEIFTSKLAAMKISDLIDVMRTRYEQDNPIKIIGIRPGEKLHEVLVNKSEIPRCFVFLEITL